METLDTSSYEWLMACGARHILAQPLAARRKILAAWGDPKSRFFKGAKFVEEMKFYMTKEHIRMQQKSMKKLAAPEKAA